MIFSTGLSQDIYIFPGGKCAQLPFSGWETYFFFYNHFFLGIKLSKIQFQEIYESDDHS